MKKSRNEMKSTYSVKYQAPACDSSTGSARVSSENKADLKNQQEIDFDR